MEEGRQQHMVTIAPHAWSGMHVCGWNSHNPLREVMVIQYQDAQMTFSQRIRSTAANWSLCWSARPKMVTNNEITGQAAESFIISLYFGFYLKVILKYTFLLLNLFIWK